MKKKFTFSAVLLFAIIALSTSSFAQFKMSLVPSAGLNFNLHTGSDLPESGSGFGLVIGGYAHMNFNPNVGLVGGLAFYDNRYGSYSVDDNTQIDGTPVNYTTETGASLAYFQIETLFKYTLPQSTFYFVVGPVFGFNVSGEQEVTQTINTAGFQFNNGSNSQTQKGTIRNTNMRFEFKAGAGLDIPMGSIALTPQVSFGYGITNVVENVTWKILTLQALVGVKIPVI